MQSFYLHKLFYFIGFGSVALFVASHFIPVLYAVAVILVVFLFIMVLIDAFLLYNKKRGISANRLVKDRLSNGDDNTVVLTFFNSYHFKINCSVIDELPFQFQERNGVKEITINNEQEGSVVYTLKPIERGEYEFGNIIVMVSSPLALVQRRFVFHQAKTVKVYPSYLQMRRYSLLAIGNNLAETGSKRIRKLGHSMEFEQIKEYVRGDDYRTINWKATARNGSMMVNKFTDERSQQIYCVINKGRTMKMPFDGITLLDYAINASLVLSNIALQKGDKAGLITYAESMGCFLTADKKPGQLGRIQEELYQQQTTFLEPDNEKLFSVVRNRINQRCLLLLFTNFESIESLLRQLPFLKSLAHYHLLVVVFFENTELKTLLETKVKTIEDIYIKTIAEKYAHEKRLMVKELQKQGIIAMLTPPQKLTANTLNKYLELKNRQSI